MANPKTTRSATEDADLGETQQQLAARQVAAASGGGASAATVASAPVNAAVVAMAAVHREAKPAIESRVQPAESAFKHYRFVADAGVTKADLERTSFWQHCCRLFRNGDEVRVDCEDGSFTADLRVVLVGTRDIKMFVKGFYALDQMDPEAFAVPSGYDIKWRGEIDKWSVLRGTEVVRARCDSRSDAQKWLGNHLQSLAR